MLAGFCGSCLGLFLAAPLAFPQRGNARSAKIFARPRFQLGHHARSNFRMCCSKSVQVTHKICFKSYFARNLQAGLRNVLARLRANGAFSKRSLSIFGQSRGQREALTISGRRCCLSAEVETEARVQQPPKMRKISCVPATGGEKRPERATRQDIS